MFTEDTQPQTAATLHEHLRELQVEAVLARQTGLAGNEAYMADLADERASTEAAYVGAAVTEIASLRGELNGPLLG